MKKNDTQYFNIVFNTPRYLLYLLFFFKQCSVSKFARGHVDKGANPSLRKPKTLFLVEMSPCQATPETPTPMKEAKMEVAYL